MRCSSPRSSDDRGHTDADRMLPAAAAPVCEAARPVYGAAVREPAYLGAARRRAARALDLSPVRHRPCALERLEPISRPSAVVQRRRGARAIYPATPAATPAAESP